MLVNLMKNHNIAAIHENSRYDFYKYFFQQQIELARQRLYFQGGIFSGTDFSKASWNYALKLTK